MSDCPRFGKWIGGCRFRARYDNGAAMPSPEQLSAATDGAFTCDIPEIVGLLKSQQATYVRDICVRCGKTVERKP